MKIAQQLALWADKLRDLSAQFLFFNQFVGQVFKCAALQIIHHGGT